MGVGASFTEMGISVTALLRKITLRWSFDPWRFSVYS